MAARVWRRTAVSISLRLAISESELRSPKRLCAGLVVLDCAALDFAWY